MPAYTLTTQHQVDWLVQNYPHSAHRLLWRVGYQYPSLHEDICAILDQQKSLVRWWEIYPIDLPG